MLAESFDWWTRRLRDLLEGGAGTQPGRVLVLTPAGRTAAPACRAGAFRILTSQRG